MKSVLDAPCFFHPHADDFSSSWMITWIACIGIKLYLVYVMYWLRFWKQLNVNAIHIHMCTWLPIMSLYTLRPKRNRRHFADDIFKCILLNETPLISIKISLKFIPKGPINNIPALVQIMAWRRPGDKPLSEPMMIISLTHICVTWPQWFKHFWHSWSQ